MPNTPWRRHFAPFVSMTTIARPVRVTCLCLATLSILLAGCGTIGRDDDGAEFWSPFNTQSSWEVGDGRISVEVSGFERGHEPGRTAEFNVSIENRRDQPAEIDICAKLIDEAQIVQRFEQFSLSIEPEGSESTVFNVSLDEELEPRAYGFAVVIGEVGAVIHTVRVGIPDDEAGPWLDAEELVCD